MNVISYCAAYKRKACTVNVYSWTLPSKASASLPHTKLSSVKYLRHCAEDIKKKRKIHCSYRVWSLLADHGRNISSRGWTFLTADISCKATLCGMWKKKKLRCGSRHSHMSTKNRRHMSALYCTPHLHFTIVHCSLAKIQGVVLWLPSCTTRLLLRLPIRWLVALMWHKIEN